MSTVYLDAVGRTPNDIAGDCPSVLTFGADPTGTTDNAAIFNTAISSISAAGRDSLYIPGGTYLVGTGTSSSVSVSFPSTITTGFKIYFGPGVTIQVKSGSTFPSGKGVFDINCGGVSFIGEAIFDGAVTTPAGVLYSSISTPRDSTLAGNSMFWVHGQSASPIYFLKWDGITVQHASGYAIFVDAQDGEIFNVQILNCKALNNRPHLFGTSSGDESYGSWTGGIFFSGNGSNAAVHDVLVDKCTFSYNTGNCIWSWLPSLDYLHTNFQWTNNSFNDIGLDATEVGGVTGFSVTGGNGRRIGYISLADNTIGTPKWLADYNATFLDTSGVATDGIYSSNSAVSVNGGFCSADGFGYGSITNNTCRWPSSTDPEYTVDQIASAGPAGDGELWQEGIATNNTNDTTQGACNVTISGNTLIGLGGGNALDAARNSFFTGNTIIHPTTAEAIPLQIGNIGTGTNQRVNKNVVTNNSFSWNPGSPASMVAEVTNGTAFLSTQIDYVLNNTCSPGMLEVSFDPNSGSAVGASPSGTAHLFTSNLGGATIPSAHAIQREGQNADQSAVLRFYGVENTTATLQAQLQSSCVGGSSAVYSPLLNVSKAGTSGTGTLATGNRTSVAQDSTGTYTLQDSVVTGNLYADCQLILTNTTYSDTQANILNEVQGGGSTGTAVFAALRYLPTTGYIEVSTNISSGSRTWAALSGGSSVAGSDEQIQYNHSGAFGADGNFIWNYGAQNLYITSNNATGQENITLDNGTAGYQTSMGFYDHGTQKWQVGKGNSNEFFIWDQVGLTNAINIASNGALSLNPVGNVLVKTATDDGSSGALQVDGFVSAVDGYYSISTSYQAFKALSGGINTNSASLAGYLGIASNSSVSQTAGDNWSSGPGIAYVDGNDWYFKIGNGTSTLGDTAILNAQEINASGTATATIQCASGGVTAKWLITTDSVLWIAESAPSVSASGQARIYFDSTNNLLMASLNGASYTALSTGSTPPGGSNTQVQYNSSSSFAGSSNFTWNNSSQLLTVTASSSSSAGIVCGTGYIQSDTGFYATTGSATSYQAIQAPGGGLYANSTRSIVYTQIGTNSGAPTMTSGDALQKGCIYWNTSDSYALIYNGSSWLPLNLTAGTGINISGATISCTVSGASPGGSNTDVQYNSSSSFAGSGNFVWNNSSQLLTVTAANSSSAGIACGTGYIQADAGFYATIGSATSYQAIQAPGGGLYGRSNRVLYYTQIGQSNGTINSGGSAASLTSGDSLGSGCVYWDTGTGYARIYNASTFTWYPLNLASSTGISISGNSISVSLSAGTGVSVSGATISIGQAVSTSSSVSFGSVTTTGTIQSSASGTSIAFQTSSPFNFQVNGNGVVSCQQVNVAGSTVINSSKQFVGAGVAVEANGCGAGNFNAWNGSSYDSGSSGTITLSSTSTITVLGGVIIGWS